MSQPTSNKSIKYITVKHVVINCRRPFDEVKAAVESSIPEMTTASARSQFDAGDVQGAIQALEALPPLILFNIRPRHVGPMLKALNNNSNVVQVSLATLDGFSSTLMPSIQMSSIQMPSLNA